MDNRNIHYGDIRLRKRMDDLMGRKVEVVEK